jgi:cysteinyl-tRNA synthetase
MGMTKPAPFSDDAPLMLFNSLTRALEPFTPVHPGEARVYTCGPTVYNYAHIGNMRAYVFADTLGRVLSFKGYTLKHIINITDVGHLTDDGDAGEDKLEKAAAARAQSIWDIAQHYTQAFWDDVKALNIREPAQWSVATDYVPKMIEFATSIADKHCYELASGLYFDVSTVADYGKLAREDDLFDEMMKITARLRQLDSSQSPEHIRQEFLAAAQHFLGTVRLFHSRKALQKYRDLILIWEWADQPDIDDVSNHLLQSVDLTRERLREGRIEAVDGKRNDGDFAIWRKTPDGETRQMEWDSPWGRGAPGWHLECSVMSEALLGFPFDIHTGGIDHREIHHPNEIAQNQAFQEHQTGACTHQSGANIWMHNNFLIDRTGKMSKSSGEFLRLPLLVSKGIHPLAYRLMCLQAHYRSELEFSWDNLLAALTRLKRLVMAVATLRAGAEASGSVEHPRLLQLLGDFAAAVADDLNTAKALTVLDDVLAQKKIGAGQRLAAIKAMDAVLGLDLLQLERADLRIRPTAATTGDAEIEHKLKLRKEARADKNFAASDAIRDDLVAAGVEVMDGDPLGWEWRIEV